MPSRWSPLLRRDPSANAAYISLVPPNIRVPGAVTSRPLSDLGDLDGALADTIILDFDDESRLVGIELLAARQTLYPELLTRSGSE
jgi:uncharacterized protein YuzE